MGKILLYLQVARTVWEEKHLDKCLKDGISGGQPVLWIRDGGRGSCARREVGGARKVAEGYKVHNMISQSLSDF